MCLTLYGIFRFFSETQRKKNEAKTIRFLFKSHGNGLSLTQLENRNECVDSSYLSKVVDAEKSKPSEGYLWIQCTALGIWEDMMPCFFLTLLCATKMRKNRTLSTGELQGWMDERVLCASRIRCCLQGALETLQSLTCELTVVRFYILNWINKWI